MTNKVTIQVSGSVSSGQSVVLAAISSMLRDTFGATVNVTDLKVLAPAPPTAEELARIKDTVWYLTEVCVGPVKPTKIANLPDWG